MAFRTGVETPDVPSVEQGRVGPPDERCGVAQTPSGPGEIAFSARVREQQFTPGIDGDIDDLGDRYRKQARDPVRVYRVGPRGPRPIIGAGSSPREIHPVAGVPFTIGRCGPQRPHAAYVR